MQASRSDFQFSLLVPDKDCIVYGTLQYFPFENERETIPLDTDHPSGLDPMAQFSMTQQQPALTQLLSQAPGMAAAADGVPYSCVEGICRVFDAIHSWVSGLHLF